MPGRSPFYELPRFDQTGNAELDNVLERWRVDASNSYARNLFEAERLPVFTSTYRVTTGVLLTTVQSAYCSTSIGLQGGESFLVYANARLLSQGELAQGIVEVTFPNGDTVQLTSARLIHEHNDSGSYSFANVGNLWTVSPKTQFGGEHTVSLLVNKVTTAGTTSSIYAGSLVLMGF